MITEGYVSFETARLLKEKGFDECCYGYYYEPNHLSHSTFDITNSELETESYSAPTLQIAMKWLREVHNYDISICLDSYVEPYDNEYYIVIRRRKVRFEEVSPCEQVYFKTYEEACEAGIKYCLENLI